MYLEKSQLYVKIVQNFVPYRQDRRKEKSFPFPSKFVPFISRMFPNIARVKKITIYFFLNSSPISNRSFDDSTLVSARRKTFNVSRNGGSLLGTRGYGSNEARGSRATLFTAATTTTLSPEGCLRILARSNFPTGYPGKRKERERGEERRGEEEERSISRAKRLVNAT